MSHEVVSMGSVYLDFNSPRFPIGSGLLPEREYVGQEYETTPGGSAFNFARTCAALEMRSVFIGKIGNDRIGHVLEDLARETGVITAFIKSDSVSTNVSTNLIGENGQTIMAVIGTANQALAAAEISEKLESLSSAKYLYLGGSFKLHALLPYLGDFARKAQEEGAKIVLDHGRITNVVTEEDKQVIRDLIPQVDYYLPSHDELLELWNEESVEKAAQKILELAPRITIVVKNGSEGAYWVNSSGSGKTPAFKVPVVNTVGAGDSFNAGFIRAQSLGLNLKFSVDFACATAAVKISQPGFPNIGQVDRMLYADDRIT